VRLPRDVHQAAGAFFLGDVEYVVEQVEGDFGRVDRWICHAPHGGGSREYGTSGCPLPDGVDIECCPLPAAGGNGPVLNSVGRAVRMGKCG